MNKSAYYKSYYQDKKEMYKERYRQQKLSKLKNQILFEDHGGEAAYYANQYKEFAAKYREQSNLSDTPPR